MRIQTIILLLAALSTGIMAGTFFTWSNAVTSGIARLTDLEYLRAFQSMNRTILNPTFFFVFFGPALLLPIASFLHFKSFPNVLFWMILAASLVYLIGVIAVTFAGNVPLNTMLDKSDLEGLSLEQAKSLREIFENKWNSLNWIRTCSSIGAFLILIITCISTKI